MHTKHNQQHGVNWFAPWFWTLRSLDLKHYDQNMHKPKKKFVESTKVLAKDINPHIFELQLHAHPIEKCIRGNKLTHTTKYIKKCNNWSVTAGSL